VVFSDYGERKFYYPLKKIMQSLFFSNIDTFNEEVIPIFEIMLGRDTIMIDNEGIFLGLFKRVKNFLNIKQYRLLKDIKTDYVVNNAFGNGL